MLSTYARRRATFVAAVISTSLLVAALPLGAAPPGDNGPIAYTTDAGLHVVEPDGSGARLVAEGTFHRPDVSPDGTAVLVTAAQPGETGPLVSIDLYTGAETTVVEDALAGVWSGDGERVAYADDAGIWVQEGEADAVMVSEVHSDVFDWSPVDDRVIVVRSVQSGGFPEYYLETLDVVTEEVVLIRDNGPGEFTWYSMDADFSPDGADIVYSSVSPGVIEIVIAGDEGNPLDSGSVWGSPSGHVAWSPDGTTIAYPTYVANEAGTGGVPVMAVHVVATDGRTEFESDADEVQWAPLATDEPETAEFEDVAEDNLFYADIVWLAEEGITRGCNPPDNTLFCPDDPVTRGQMAAFLVRAFGYTDDGGGDLFGDDDASVFEGDIDRLATAGVTRGCNPPTNDRFCPDEFVTRGQMAAFLVRAFGYTDDGGGDLFGDDDASVFEGDIDRLATAGVTRGCNPPTNDRFCPDEFVTRGQMAAFLVRAFGYTDDGGGDLFGDDDASVFEGDIDRLATAGVTRGCNPPTNDRFCPDDLVTRGQMAAFLHRAFEG